MTAGDENQFIVPPPGISPKRSHERSREPEPAAAQDLIDLPPGIVDSGTYRVPVPRVAKPDRRDDAPVFFPTAAPGLPPAAGPVRAATSDPMPSTDPVSVVAALVEAVDDATRVSIGRRGTPLWRFSLPDGQEIVVGQTILVGRDPAAGTQWPEATLLAVDDAAKSVSKTHAALEITASGQLLVHDLNSTNGVSLQYPEAQEIVVEPGSPEFVEPGAVLGFGEFTVAIRRA